MEDEVIVDFLNESALGKPYILTFGSYNGGQMREYITVSVKIPREVKEKLDKLGIKPSKLLRRVIEEEIRKEEVRVIKKEIERLRKTLDEIPMEEIVKSIREDRNSR